MIGSTNAGGGIGGGSITVTAEVSATATVSNELTGRHMSKPVSSGQPAVFKNLTAGDWLVTVDNGTAPVTETVNIVLDHTVRATFFSANISISYPAGSVCTATMGSYSFTAPNTSGSWTLAVPAMGTWHVRCTDGQDTAEADVNITASGQTTSVSLVYKLVLYSPGDEHTAVTGGWKVYQNASLSKQTTQLKITPTKQYDGNQGLVGCTNMIDLTKYTTLYAEGLNNCAGAEYLGFVIYDANLTRKAAAWWDPNQNTTKSLNVSNLTGTYYVGFEVYWGGTYKGDGRIYNVWGVK